MTSYKLGHISFILEGAGDVLEYLQKEFACIESPVTSEPAIIFRFVDRLSPLTSTTAIKPLLVGQDSYEARDSYFYYQVHAKEQSFDVQIATQIPTTTRFNPLAHWHRLKHWNYLWPAELAAKNFVYNVFDPLSQIVHLRHKSSYLHASSFVRDGHGVALVAWGGVGKTSALLQMVSEHDWQFLSDDLGLIDSSGVLWRTPKKLQIYGYNIANLARLRRQLFAGRSIPDRLSWMWKHSAYGPDRVRRRVSAEEFFGPSAVAKSAPLKTVLFLERTNRKDFDATPLEPCELARRSAIILLEELQPYTRHSIALHSSKKPAPLPHISSMIERSQSILEAAFNDRRTLLLRIPMEANPEALSEFLLQQLDYS